MCKYCKGNKNYNSVPIINNKFIGIQLKYGEMDISHLDENGYSEHSFTSINYCPMCGRKLLKGE